MKRLAVLVAAEEAVGAYHDLLEHPGPEAELRLQGCIALLSLRLAVFQRHGLEADEPIRLPYHYAEARHGVKRLHDLDDSALVRT